MRKARSLAMVAALSAGVTACSPNAATFYEGTRFAFVTEYNPASGEPVNLTLGYKRRIAAVVPPQTPAKDSNSPHKGESLSLVSTFEVEPGPRIGDGITIRNVFASGMAARDLTETNAEGRVKSLFSASSIPHVSPEVRARRRALGAKIDLGNLPNDKADAVLKAAGLRPTPPAGCTVNPAVEARCTLQTVLSEADERTLEKLESASMRIILAPAGP